MTIPSAKVSARGSESGTPWSWPGGLGSSLSEIEHLRARVAELEDELAKARDPRNWVCASGALFPEAGVSDLAAVLGRSISAARQIASTCVRMLSSGSPNVSGALDTARRTIRDANRVLEVVTRLRALFANNSSTRSEVDLNDAALEVISLMSKDLSRNGACVRTELAADLPTITADRVQLQQVILNLIRNASDAMSGIDGPRAIKLRTAPDPDGNVRLSVQDRGVGFPAGSQEQIFQRFYTTKDTGVGIGLSVSRTIVESHSGRLWAEAAPGGVGALFAFTIPLRR